MPIQFSCAHWIILKELFSSQQTELVNSTKLSCREYTLRSVTIRWTTMLGNKFGRLSSGNSKRTIGMEARKSSTTTTLNNMYAKVMTSKVSSGTGERFATVNIGSSPRLSGLTKSFQLSKQLLRSQSLTPRPQDKRVVQRPNAFLYSRKRI
jgi:hypothetical protein